MRRIESFENDMKRIETWELPDCRMITFSSDMVDDLGIQECLRREGLDVEVERVPVHQGGVHIGSVPGTFDPRRIRSTSFLYDPRPGDFIRRHDRWDADRMLGPGDFECIPGFVWDREARKERVDDNQ